MSEERRVWWLDMAGYDADACRWLLDGVDGRMNGREQVAYLRSRLDAVPWRTDLVGSLDADAG